MAYSETMQAFLLLVQRAKEGYPAEEENVVFYDNQTQDILHELELVPHSASQIMKLAKQLSATRQERRLSKNNLELLHPIVEWANKHKNAINDLKDALAEVAIKEEALLNREYRYRTTVVQDTLGGKKK